MLMTDSWSELPIVLSLHVHSSRYFETSLPVPINPRFHLQSHHIPEQLKCQFCCSKRRVYCNRPVHMYKRAGPWVGAAMRCSIYYSDLSYFKICHYSSPKHLLYSCERNGLNIITFYLTQNYGYYDQNKQSSSLATPAL